MNYIKTTLLLTIKYFTNPVYWGQFFKQCCPVCGWLFYVFFLNGSSYQSKTEYCSHWEYTMFISKLWVPSTDTVLSTSKSQVLHIVVTFIRPLHKSAIVSPVIGGYTWDRRYLIRHLKGLLSAKGFWNPMMGYCNSKCRVFYWVDGAKGQS